MKCNCCFRFFKEDPEFEGLHLTNIKCSDCDKEMVCACCLDCSIYFGFKLEAIRCDTTRPGKHLIDADYNKYELKDKDSYYKISNIVDGVTLYTRKAGPAERLYGICITCKNFNKEYYCKTCREFKNGKEQRLTIMACINHTIPICPKCNKKMEREYIVIDYI